MRSFIKSEVKTFQHQIAIWSIPIIIISGYFNPYFLWGGLAVFFLVTSFKLLKSIIVWFLIILGLTIVFPPLAPFVFILMIIFFFLRLGYVAENWRPFFYGMLFYGAMAFIIIDTWEFYQYGISRIAYYTGALLGGFEFFLLASEELRLLILSAPVAVAMMLILHFMLIDCYRNGYKSFVALGIMGSVPLILISLLLPFLKIPIGDVMMGDTYAAKDPVVTPDKKYVAPYVRTAPDSMLENNYSYNAPDKIAENKDSVQVKGYWRSTPGETSDVGEGHNVVTQNPSSESKATFMPGYESRKRKKSKLS